MVEGMSLRLEGYFLIFAGMSVHANNFRPVQQIGHERDRGVENSGSRARLQRCEGILFRSQSIVFDGWKSQALAQVYISRLQFQYCSKAWALVLFNFSPFL
jgi:hypothetical protein